MIGQLLIQEFFYSEKPEAFCKRKYKYLWRTDVGLIRLGQDGDEHGEGAVVVQQAEEEPDAAEDNSSVGVESHHQHGQPGGEEEQVLAARQSPALVPHCV